MNALSSKRRSDVHPSGAQINDLLSGPQAMRIMRNVVYAKMPEKRLLLDLFLPLEFTSPVPVVVAIHGGGFRKNSKDDWYKQINYVGCLVEQGYAIAAISYRLSQEALFPAQIHDCKAAVRWLRENAAVYGLDKERMAAIGGSAGAHLAVMLGVTANMPELEGAGPHLNQPSDVCAVVNFFGPSDFIALAEGREDSPDGAIYQLLGGSMSEKHELAQIASPITHVDANAAPTLHFHGKSDPLIPYQQSVALHDKFIQKDVKSKLVLVEGAGHSMRECLADPVNLELFLTFLNTHLRRRVI